MQTAATTPVENIPLDNLNVSPKGANQEIPPEIVEMVQVLVKKFTLAQRVFVFNMPEHLRSTFKDVFGTHVDKDTFKEWVKDLGIDLDNIGEDDWEQNFPASAELGTTNTPVSPVPTHQGTRENTAQEMGKDEKEFYELLIQAVTNAVPIKRAYDALSIAVLYRNKRLTYDQVLEQTMHLNKMLNNKYSQSSLRKAVSDVLNSRDIVRKIEERNVTYYELYSDVSDEITNKLTELFEAAAVKKEMADKRASTFEEMVDKIYTFFKVYTTDNGKKLYVEKLKDLIVNGGKALEVDYSHLLAFVPDVAENLIVKPSEVLEASEKAIAKLLEDLGIGLTDKKAPSIKVRFYNLLETHAPKDLRSSHLNKFVQVEGIVTRATDVKPFVSVAVYVCEDCGREITTPQSPFSDYLKKPPKCPFCGSHRLVRDDESSIYTNYQVIRIQDAPDTLKGRQTPRVIDVVLVDDLVDTVNPGDHVILTGIFKGVEKKVENKPFLQKILVANHIKSFNTDFDAIELTEEDIQKIHEEVKKPGFKERLVRSIAPEIYGMEEIKEAVTLSLASSTRIRRPDGAPMRGNIHILLVGDPGKGKSKILRFLEQVAPRAVFASAEGVTKAGFTAAVTKDEMTGGWVVEAGVMVLADQGFALLDEFEKMSDEDRASIHIAMEDGKVTIHKATIHTELNARATVIAAANPVRGKWNLNEELAKQINLPPSLLSRFDLIFPVIDIPNEKEDLKIVNSILNIEGEVKEERGPYDVEFLKKFFAYVRRRNPPEFTNEAKTMLRDYFVKLRKKSKTEGGYVKVMITTRQLEALIRLATAHAKLHLRDVVTPEDVYAAIHILESSYRLLMSGDEELDILQIMIGKPFKDLVLGDEVLKAVAMLDDGDGAPESAIVTLMKEKGATEEKVLKVLEDLKQDGLVTVIGVHKGVPFYRVTPK